MKKAPQSEEEEKVYSMFLDSQETCNRCCSADDSIVFQGLTTGAGIVLLISTTNLNLTLYPGLLEVLTRFETAYHWLPFGFSRHHNSRSRFGGDARLAREGTSTTHALRFAGASSLQVMQQLTKHSSNSPSRFFNISRWDLLSCRYCSSTDVCSQSIVTSILLAGYWLLFAPSGPSRVS